MVSSNLHNVSVIATDSVPVEHC